MTGSRSELDYRDLPRDDPKQRRPDISFARKQIDWQPSLPLREGLRHTIDYFDALLADREPAEVAASSKRKLLDATAA